MNKITGTMFYNSPVGCIQIKISGSLINEIIFIKKEEKKTEGQSNTLSAEGKQILKNVPSN